MRDQRFVLLVDADSTDLASTTMLLESAEDGAPQSPYELD